MESEFSFETTNQAKRQTNQPNKEIKKKNMFTVVLLKMQGT
jgi:hypothetical protein